MKPPRTIWIILPAVAFAVLLIFFVIRLPRPNSATSTASPSPTSDLQLPTPIPAVTSELQVLTGEIRSFRLDDPELSAPSFSRSLDIPEE